MPPASGSTRPDLVSRPSRRARRPRRARTGCGWCGAASCPSVLLSHGGKLRESRQRPPVWPSPALLYRPTARRVRTISPLDERSLRSREVAGRPVARLVLDELRIHLGTDLLGLPAARVEPASGGRVHR